MARGRRTLELNAGVDPDVQPAENPEETGGAGAHSIFDFQGDARVRVLHRNEKTQRFEPHGYFPPDCTEETILSEFGGGRYRVQLLVRDDTGREIIKTTRDIDLPGPYKPPAGDLPGIASRANGAKGQLAAPQQVLVPTGGDDLTQVLKAGLINTLLDLMKATKEATRPAPSSTDPMMLEFMKSQAAMQQQLFTLLITSMQQQNAKPDSESRDYLSMMAKMKELLTPMQGGANPNPMEMFNTMLETFTRLRETAEDIVPQRDQGDPLLGSLPKLVEVVAEQHQMQKEAARVRTVPTPAPHGGVAQMPQVNTLPANPPMPDLPLWKMVLRQQSARLVASATAKHDPDVIAGVAITFAPENVREALAIFFHRENDAILADVLAEIPAMAEHREWLVEFIEAAQERLFPDEFVDEDDEDENDGEAGDAETIEQ